MGVKTCALCVQFSVHLVWMCFPVKSELHYFIEIAKHVWFVFKTSFDFILQHCSTPQVRNCWNTWYLHVALGLKIDYPVFHWGQCIQAVALHTSLSSGLDVLLLNREEHQYKHRLYSNFSLNTDTLSSLLWSYVLRARFLHYLAVWILHLQ